MMNREIQITIIACAIVFAGISVLAYETMNSDKGTTSVKHAPIKNMDVVRDPGVLKIPKTDDFSIEKLKKYPQTMDKKIDDNTIVRRTITSLIISDENKFPWGTIYGKVTNPTAGHPVIIKFYKSLDEIPVHVAQVDLKVDNTFEYKFRLFSIDDGITTHIFEGDYYIEVFRTVNIQ